MVLGVSTKFIIDTNTAVINVAAIDNANPLRRNPKYMPITAHAYGYSRYNDQGYPGETKIFNRL